MRSKHLFFRFNFEHFAGFPKTCENFARFSSKHREELFFAIQLLVCQFADLLSWAMSEEKGYLKFVGRRVCLKLFRCPMLTSAVSGRWPHLRDAAKKRLFGWCFCIQAANLKLLLRPHRIWKWQNFVSKGFIFRFFGFCDCFCSG